MPKATIRRLQWYVTLGLLAAWCLFQLYATFHPAPDDIQSIGEIQTHPIASYLGSIADAVILSPLLFLLIGFGLRRGLGRFKACEHCAATIKAEAKVCRFCRRDLTTA